MKDTLEQTNNRSRRILQHNLWSIIYFLFRFQSIANVPTSFDTKMEPNENNTILTPSFLDWYFEEVRMNLYNMDPVVILFMGGLSALILVLLCMAFQGGNVCKGCNWLYRLICRSFSSLKIKICGIWHWLITDLRFSGKKKDEVKALRTRLAKTERELEETKRELEETKRELEEKKSELDETKNRLSAIISSRIRDNNPNIVNLGDQFRPNKLGEMSSELYDNEWTDAFEELARKDYAETESIQIFLDIIMTTYQLCKKSIEDDWAIVKDWIPDDGESATIRLALREGKKAKAVRAMANHQSKIAQVLTAGCRDDKLRPLVSGSGPVYDYVNACVKLCLLMVLHDPPVVWKCPQWSSDMFLAQPLCADVSDARVGMPEQIAMSMKKKDTANDLGGSKTIQFDTSFFKPYTAAGNYIKHIVWPAMLLHENGPILRKGIAQGFYKEVSSESTCVNILT